MEFVTNASYCHNQQNYNLYGEKKLLLDISYCTDMSHKLEKVLPGFLRLRCGKKRFIVSKDFLCSNSRFFESRIRENPSVDDMLVIGIKEAIMQFILDFVFYGTATIEENNIKDVIVAAQAFKILGLEGMTLSHEDIQLYSSAPIFVLDVFDEATVATSGASAARGYAVITEEGLMLLPVLPLAGAADTNP